MIKRHQGLTYLILIMAFCLALISSKLDPSKDPKETTNDAHFNGTEITFLDVGQGDSVFLKTRNGETWLIDGGEDNEAEAELLPYLRNRGIEKIDFAVVTHYHSDHTGGIFRLLKAGRIKTLILPDYTPDNKARSGLLKNAEKTNTAVLDVSAGDVLETDDKDLKLEVLHPEEGGFSQKDENNNSMVLFLRHFKTSVLLTGDLEEDAEAEIKDKYDLEADVLKVGHHGSMTSTSQDFLAEVDPTYAVIPVGEDNSYGHPHYEVLQRLENDDVRVYRTDTDGDITFYLNEEGVAKIATEE